MLGLHRRINASHLFSVLLLLLSIAASRPASADDLAIPDLVYKMATGEVTLDPTDGGSIIGYDLKSSGSFLPANFTPALGGVSTATTTDLSEASLTALTTPADIGAVFPTWLDAAGLDALLTTRDVSTALGLPLVDFDLIVQLPATPSNASFDSFSDVDILNLDLGTFNLGASAPAVNFSVANVAPAGDTARLDLTTIIGSGDTATLTTDLAPFSNVLAGSDQTFSASVDTSDLGSFNASYELQLTDILGTNQTLTLNLSASIELQDDPTVPDLIYYGSTGEVVLDPTDSGSLIGYVLKSNNDFLPGNFTPILGGVSTSTTAEISEASLTAITTPMSIGNVLPAGLTAGDLISLLDNRDASVSLGAPVVPFDIKVGCIVGDANCDGYVDIAGDIISAFSNFTGPGSFGKTRIQGDVHHSVTGATTTVDPADGDVDVSDLLTMFGAFTGPPADASGAGGLAAAAAGDPGTPDLIYDAATGEVFLDVDGSGIIGYVLKNGAGTFLAGNHTTILAGVSTSLPGELSEAAFASPVGSNSIGVVFPTGMNLAALTAYLSTNEVSTSLGAPVVPFDLVVLTAGPTVPEPATVVMSLCGLLMLGLITIRRRR